MTIPITDLADGWEKELKQVSRSIDNRLKQLDDGRLSRGNAPNVYQGRPQGGNIPDEDYGIWYEPFRVRGPREEGVFAGDYLVSMWRFYVVVRDQSEDRYGFDIGPGIMLTGGIFEQLTETFDDTSLDSAVDFTVFQDARRTQGQEQGGDDEMEQWEMDVQAEHNLLEWGRA